jgi:hypothetical protein
MSQNLSLPDLIQQGQLPPHSEEKAQCRRLSKTVETMSSDRRRC